MELGDYLLNNNPQLSKASVEIEEKAWDRLACDGAAEPTTFKLGGPELHTVAALREKHATWSITSGVDGLVILKTTKSAFTGYIKDRLTTLKAGHRSHLWHQRDRYVGLCDRDAAIRRSALPDSRRAAPAVRRA